ncbi:MAG: ABC transporter permease [Ardenticatenaceae bacterium]|nr:ABC transporter permease [Ardenticatenaceae bacterium]HBY99285.1 peptide ABC transporter permease [Chloroflexota bacterium]
MRTFQAIRRVLFSSPATVLGIVVVVLMIAVAILGPEVAPYKFNQMVLGDRLQGPSIGHPLGTDQFGRDLLTRIIYGARVSLLVGAGGTGVALLAGVILGAVSAYYGHWLDEIMMRLIDIVMAFPYIVLAIVLAWIIGPGLGNLILVIGIIRTPQFARITRGSVLSVKEYDYVEAAHSFGQRNLIILGRHILPNCISPILIYASLSIATAISAEAALSFLGLGIQPPQPSWGTLLAEGQRYMFDAPWIATFPGIAISLTILGYNLVGDGLRDALDPRLRTQR